MFKQIKIDVDTEQFEKQLDNNIKNMNKIARRMMAKVLYSVKKISRDNVKGKILNKQSGQLAKSYKVKAGIDFTGTISNNAFYASSLENGATIVPKSPDGYLRYKVGDEWISSKKSILPAQPFLLPALENEFDSGKASEIMDSIFQLALNEIYGKE